MKNASIKEFRLLVIIIAMNLLLSHFANCSNRPQTISFSKYSLWQVFFQLLLRLQFLTSKNRKQLGFKDLLYQLLLQLLALLLLPIIIQKKGSSGRSKELQNRARRLQSSEMELFLICIKMKFLLVTLSKLLRECKYPLMLWLFRLTT